jgi:hypothetical protein
MDGGILGLQPVNRIIVQVLIALRAGFFTDVFVGLTRLPELNTVIDRLAKS